MADYATDLVSADKVHKIKKTHDIDTWLTEVRPLTVPHSSALFTNNVPPAPRSPTRPPHPPILPLRSAHVESPREPTRGKDAFRVSP